MDHLLDDELVLDTHEETFDSDYSPQSLIGRDIILHLLLTSENYEDLDNPESIQTYCVSRFEPWKQLVIEKYPENTDFTEQLIILGCHNIMNSLIDCIRNSLRQHLVQRYPLR
ncbi:hypothetical protein RF11_07861 [Thelohanellus kitauei]|uniref:Uncharacterized protein n=1 Tax=Thelohanellus kitauei TaxID=669202 RepID=A0A0C2J274_THEKT|nr:hypothetical protein RF11_07861 [Thelohanellus kitauei]